MSELGKLSAEYESNGNPGTVSTGEGDYGGKSYGTYQLASKVGSVRQFLNWMKNSDDPVKRQYGTALDRFPIASANFDALWHEIARVDGDTFAKQQHDFIKATYYDVAVEKLRGVYFNIEKHSETMQDVIWSRTVQYGVGNIVEMFTDALPGIAKNIDGPAPNLSYVDHIRFDAAIIDAVYNVCMTRKWNNTGLRDSLNQRFVKEKEDAIKMLKAELHITDW